MESEVTRIGKMTMLAFTCVALASTVKFSENLLSQAIGNASTLPFGPNVMVRTQGACILRQDPYREHRCRS